MFQSESVIAQPIASENKFFFLWPRWFMAEFASNSSTWPSWFVRICFVSEMDWPNWRSLWPKWSAFGDELVCGRHGCDPPDRPSSGFMRLPSNPGVIQTRTVLVTTVVCCTVPIGTRNVVFDCFIIYNNSSSYHHHQFAAGRVLNKSSDWRMFFHACIGCTYYVHPCPTGLWQFAWVHNFIQDVLPGIGVPPSPPTQSARSPPGVLSTTRYIVSDRYRHDTGSSSSFCRTVEDCYKL